ncbi:hypothetical protein B0T25DRAFT_633417 [Lasiosphaeria hispida]|uniref:Uncharacterized protein n=1 Tax=Lasiosphaeria hispida TaxID=260671 RepID=A0AAJ0HGJ7_9PEZI|nr:hypothetical protein B0T25DRAFT_633417 [Lasiosphaeria hispida]
MASCLYVVTLCEAPAFQRRGVGSALLKWGTDLAEAGDTFITCSHPPQQSTLPLATPHGYLRPVPIVTSMADNDQPIEGQPITGTGDIPGSVAETIMATTDIEDPLQTPTKAGGQGSIQPFGSPMCNGFYITGNGGVGIAPGPVASAASSASVLQAWVICQLLSLATTRFFLRLARY